MRKSLPRSDRRPRAEYLARLHRVFDELQAHPEHPWTLEELARIACFSPFHFHRIFQGITGESPMAFVLRVRLERAANALLTEPSLPITEIAFRGGFSSSAVFSRAFARQFRVSASIWRAQKSKNRKALLGARPYSAVVARESAPVRRDASACPVEVRVLVPRLVAYVAALDGYTRRGIGRAWGTLTQWADDQGLLSGSPVMIGISFDNPEITPAQRCRYYACMTVPTGTPPDGPVGLLTIPGGKHAVMRFRGTGDQIAHAYRTLYAGWLPSSGWLPADRPCHEIYHTPLGGTNRILESEICLPLRPLRHSTP